MTDVNAVIDALVELNYDALDWETADDMLRSNGIRAALTTAVGVAEGLDRDAAMERAADLIDAHINRHKEDTNG